MEKNSSSVRSGICRPDGAGELGGAGGYKDFAPDGAVKRRKRIVLNRPKDTLSHKQMKPVAWLLKNVVLPLAPFLVGALIRFLHSGKISWECLSATELAFSMALMFLILTANTARLTNPALKDSLNNGFYLGVVVFWRFSPLLYFLKLTLRRPFRIF